MDADFQTLDSYTALKIFNYLPLKTRILCEQVCRDWRYLLESNQWPVQQHITVKINVIERTFAHEFVSIVCNSGNVGNNPELHPVEGPSSIDILIVQNKANIRLKKDFHSKLFTIIKK